MNNRLPGLDSLRGIAASVVVLGHLSYGGRFLAGDSGPLWHQFVGVLRLFFNGPAAVIVFFVVSGLCIHWPYRTGAPLNVVSFYSRRLVRIAVPAIAAIALWKLVGSRPFPLTETVFWSIVCECTYYTLYPFLRWVRDRLPGWSGLIAVSYLTAFALCVANLSFIEAQPGDGNTYLGLRGFTWLVGLPCWLLGCWLAENVSRFKPTRPNWMWAIRGGVLAASVLVTVLYRIHPSVWLRYCFTLNLFALAACAWVGFELAYFAVTRPPRWSEWVGRWSYSLYLTHPVVADHINAAGWLLIWSGIQGRFLALLAIAGTAYAFYLLIEAPAHRIAIAVGARLAGRRPQKLVLDT